MKLYDTIKLSLKNCYYKIKLAIDQKKVNRLFAKNNYVINDKIFEKQLEINIQRHELDLPDKNEFVYENYVQ